MMDSVVLLAGSLLPIMVVGIVWIMIRFYSPRLSRIDEQLHAITLVLNEMPKEMSLQEYMFSQDQRLSRIGEKLDAHPDAALLQQYIQEHTQQLNTIIHMLGEGNKTGPGKADLENSLQTINDALEKVLWSLRFDEGKYAESTAATGNMLAESAKAKVESPGEDSKAQDDAKSMKAILKDNNDNYDAMLKYMQKTGKGGSNALHALDTAKRLRGR